MLSEHHFANDLDRKQSLCPTLTVVLDSFKQPSSGQFSNGSKFIRL